MEECLKHWFPEASTLFSPTCCDDVIVWYCFCSPLLAFTEIILGHLTSICAAAAVSCKKY